MLNYLKIQLWVWRPPPEISTPPTLYASTTECYSFFHNFCMKHINANEFDDYHDQYDVVFEIYLLNPSQIGVL